MKFPEKIESPILFVASIVTYSLFNLFSLFDLFKAPESSLKEFNQYSQITAQIELDSTVNGDNGKLYAAGLEALNNCEKFKTNKDAKALIKLRSDVAYCSSILTAGPLELSTTESEPVPLNISQITHLVNLQKRIKPEDQIEISNYQDPKLVMFSLGSIDPPEVNISF